MHYQICPLLLSKFGSDVHVLFLRPVRSRASSCVVLCIYRLVCKYKKSNMSIPDTYMDFMSCVCIYCCTTRTFCSEKQTQATLEHQATEEWWGSHRGWRSSSITRGGTCRPGWIGRRVLVAFVVYGTLMQKCDQMCMFGEIVKGSIHSATHRLNLKIWGLGIP